MVTLNRHSFSIAIVYPRAGRAAAMTWWLALWLAFTLLVFVSNSANAALREYRVSFAPSPSSSATGYTLHVGPESGNYSFDFDLGAPPAQGGTVIYAVDFEDSIDLFFALRAYDSAGARSVLSNELRVEAILAAAPPPAAPTPTPTPPPADPTPEPPPVAPAPDNGTGGEPGGSETTGGDAGSGGVDGGDVAGDPGAPGDMLDKRFPIGLAATNAGLISSLLSDGGLEFLTMDSLAARGNLRPVRCDLDGDGDRDLVIGFGPGSGGQVAVILLENEMVSSVSTITAGPENYRARSGRTNPACGDLDGDGRAEIVIGFGLRMRGVVQIFDDVQTGFAPLASQRSNADGYMQLPVPDGFWGPIYPALGNVDGDAMDELVFGMGRTAGGGRLVILDDLATDFAIHSGNRTGEPWLRVDADPVRMQSRTRTMPALGDLDGDGRDEIAVSFGRGSGARVAVLNDAIDGFPMASSDVFLLTTGRPNYQRRDGATRSAFGDADRDGLDELIVGFRRSGGHEVQIFDDMRVGMRPMGTDDGFVSALDGSTEIIPTPTN